MKSARKVGVKMSSAVAVLLLAVGLFLPTAVSAQSAFAGVVTDSTGAVLPGVSVEARSPALIEQVRSTTTAENGQYRITELRPGVYSVTFTLAGFTTVVRDGITLEANFTAPLSVQLRVGTVQETVTVSGVSPIVDVQSTQRREVVGREMIEALPTARSLQTIAAPLPAVSVDRFDVGGSTQLWQGSVTAYGSASGDYTATMDGMNAATNGSTIGQYYNAGAVEEYVIQVSAGNAEQQTSGVVINMIPRQGSNRLTADGVAYWAGSSLQSKNLSPELKSAGLNPAKLVKDYDVNLNVGGPILQNKLWVFGSARLWTYDTEFFNVFHDGKMGPAGAPVIDENLAQAYRAQLTWQATSKVKVTAMREETPKYRKYFGSNASTTRPEAIWQQKQPQSYVESIKGTATLTNKLLFETGLLINGYNIWRAYQDEVRLPTATDPYGDIPKIDLLDNIARGAPNLQSRQPKVRYVSVASLSYVTGAHNFKFGFQGNVGWTSELTESAPSMQQRYRGGVPNSVILYNYPYNSRSENKDLALYVQDSWTVGRVTLNPGFRYDYFSGYVGQQDAPLGRWVPARSYPAVTDIPTLNNFSPRIGVAFDLFGSGKTVVKGTVGHFVAQMGTGYASQFNALANDSDTRNWNDLNGNDIAEPNELGPSQNLAFGSVRTRSLNPDPDLTREHNWLYNVTLQHELRQGLGLSVSYNRRSYDDVQFTDNLAVTLADYALLTTPDPRGNGQSLPVYSLSSAKLGLTNNLLTNSDNTASYNGFDFFLRGRLRNGADFSGGASTGRRIAITCQVTNPNSLRFCDQSQYDIPFLTTYKVSGAYPLPVPGGFRVSAILSSIPGGEIETTYPVTRTQLPTLTASSVSVRLNEPGSDYYPRVKQMDVSIAGSIRLRRLHLRPQIQFFNALNAVPILTQTNVFGPALGRPLTILPLRLMRVGMQIDF